MLICTLGRKSLQKPSFYINNISNSELFGSDMLLSIHMTYFLIYKNKSSYLVFEYDYKSGDKDEKKNGESYDCHNPDLILSCKHD